MRALIFGVSGQDGSYLAEFLLSIGYEVLGVARYHAGGFDSRYLVDARGLVVLNVDITDSANVVECIARYKPDEVYNLAAQSFVGSSWDAPSYVLGVNTVGVSNVLDACRMVNPEIRVYQASSSEMFGNRLAASPISEPPQTTMLMADDMTMPRSPYGISKLAAHHLVRVYRESHGMFCVSGIAFNHESERRGLMFVTRKIAVGMAAIKAGRISKIPLGTLDAYRDWGYAPEYVVGMWKMLRQEKPKDYILATGEAHSVREFLNATAEAMYMPEAGESYAEVKGSLERPAEVWRLVGDTLPAKEQLGWEAKVGFLELVWRMAAPELIGMGFVPRQSYPSYRELGAWRDASLTGGEENS